VLWRALTQVPALSEAQWRVLGPALRWLIASRASVLPLTMASTLFGAVLAWPWIDWFDFALVLSALLLAHATNNLLNDHVDVTSGLDEGNYFRARYGTHPLAAGWMSLSEHRRYVLLTGGAALALALLVGWRAGGVVLWPALAGAFLLLFYTWPLKRWALGELAVWLAWGPLMVVGVTATLRGSVAVGDLAPASIFGLGPLLVILAKHTDKLHDDRRRGIRTLPAVLGDRASRLLMAGVLAGQLLACLWIGWFYLVAWLALPWAIRFVRQIRSPRPQQAPPVALAAAWPLWFTVGAFTYARVVGLLLVLGALLSRIFGSP
jgi:1,4-dihydroxy-2-naphthoate octaprenyltransferase